MPVHSPVSAVSVSPSRAVPEIDGRAVFAGGVGSTVAVAADDAVSRPPGFVAVTTTRIVWPTSSAVGR